MLLSALIVDDEKNGREIVEIGIKINNFVYFYIFAESTSIYGH